MGIKNVTTADVRRMNGTEALIIQGCGGDLQEWADGINDQLTEAGILRNGSRIENCFTFTNDGITCLGFSLDDADADLGKLAMWRLQTHELFGGTWLTDYVPNRLGGFVTENEQTQKKPDCPLIGENSIAKLLKESAESVLSGLADNEIQSIEKRLKEIDKARNDFVELIANGACGADSLDNEFAQLFAEEEKLSEKLLALRSQNHSSTETQSRLENELREIENARFELDRFNDVIIRKVIECIKVLSKTEILIIFKGGFEVKTEIEK